MRNKFFWKSFISIGLLFSFIILVISGVVLYIAPEGSISRWIAWDVLSLSKKQWEYQHTIFSYLFIVFSFLHIFKINWRFLFSYFAVRNFRIGFLKEITAAMAITIVVFMGTLFNWSPFSSIIQFGSDLSDAYGENLELPNTSDAEKLSMHEFAQKIFKISYLDLKRMLHSYDFEQINEGTTVIEFCELNKLSPSEFYVFIMNKQTQWNSEENMVGGDFSENSSSLSNK